MKFSCTQENLKKGLLNIVHVAGKNINLPILSNVLIEVSNNIKFTSTDLEIGVVSSVRGKIEKEGKTTINAKLFTDYINLLPNKRVDVELINNEILIKCENYKTKINAENADDYPIIPAIEKENYYSFEFEEFKKAVNEVIFAAAADETRIELSGVYFEFHQNELILAATDSYRLAERKIKYKEKPEEQKDIIKKIIIPTKTLQEAIRISSTSQDIEVSSDEPNHKIKIYITENQILFTYDEVELVSRVIEGQYPDYRQIIPSTDEKNRTLVSIGRQDLIRAIKASSLFSKANINDVHFDFPKAKNQAVISSVGSQKGESTVELPIEIIGMDNGVVLNYKYLLDGLNSLNSDEVVLEIVNSNTPVSLKAKNRQDYLYIIMPIRQ
ncbi:DNA polymerase III subunit beta [Candidatus Falkowbacteria bacterium CG10_big_fil_rev_8_21_14_0_10_43_10]|uniref:Beta sliding clamp n=1 Tax=Candidatus Falkowbacteria bacterium CG10_big_fil_rev_8_21_14_0_10_43_10 TaxID=1974567 RepID=A0A2H0V2V7_9BACT|nr:MAG: DNA polymerase III subunit beta [Candidatus Falkowbacteria bacterium CG10_big_fil_rev_8_21_14_0_10_43_10]